MEPDIKQSFVKDPDGKETELLFSEIYDMIVRFGSVDEPEQCDLWMRIPEDREPFTHEKVLGCCMDYEQRTIEYWIDDQYIPEAKFTDIQLGSGMMPALSFTGMLPSKLIFREDKLRFHQPDRGAPISQWWDNKKDECLEISTLDANPTMYIFRTELDKLRLRGEDIEHIINQLQERFGFVGFLDERPDVGVQAQINLFLTRPRNQEEESYE